MRKLKTENDTYVYEIWAVINTMSSTSECNFTTKKEINNIKLSISLKFIINLIQLGINLNRVFHGYGQADCGKYIKEQRPGYLWRRITQKDLLFEELGWWWNHI